MSDRWMMPVLVTTLLLRPPDAAAQSSAPVSGGWRTPWSYE